MNSDDDYRGDLSVCIFLKQLSGYRWWVGGISSAPFGSCLDLKRNLDREKVRSS